MKEQSVEGFKKGKIKFEGIMFYDEKCKPVELVKPSKSVKKSVEKYLNKKTWNNQ